MHVDYFDHSDGSAKSRFILGREIEPAYYETGFTYVYTGYMNDGSYRATVNDYAFFIDVRRPGGEVVRLWESKSGQNYTWADAFALPTTEQWIAYGRIHYANDAAVIFDPRRTCQP